jgi:hypothetical protein
MRSHWLLVPALLAPVTCLCAGLLLGGGVDPLEEGAQVPPFSLPTVEDETISLADFEGQVMLLNFWTAT